MSNNPDPNRLIKFEKAIREKYGDETIQNPKANWNHELETVYLKQKKEKISQEKDESIEEMIEINGVFIPKKLVTTKKSNRTCSLCKLYSFNTKDDFYMIKFEVCEKCFIKHIEDREDKWEQKKILLLKNKGKN